jgi:hypothetical protein
MISFLMLIAAIYYLFQGNMVWCAIMVILSILMRKEKKPAQVPAEPTSVPPSPAVPTSPAVPPEKPSPWKDPSPGIPYGSPGKPSLKPLVAYLTPPRMSEEMWRELKLRQELRQKAYSKTLKQDYRAQHPLNKALIGILIGIPTFILFIYFMIAGNMWATAAMAIILLVTAWALVKEPLECDTRVEPISSPAKAQACSKDLQELAKHEAALLTCPAAVNPKPRTCPAAPPGSILNGPLSLPLPVAELMLEQAKQALAKPQVTPPPMTAQLDPVKPLTTEEFILGCMNGPIHSLKEFLQLYPTEAEFYRELELGGCPANIIASIKSQGSNPWQVKPKTKIQIQINRPEGGWN